MTVERRSETRAPGVLDGAWFGEGERCRFTSLSTTGCYVETFAPPEKDAHVRVELELPTGALSVDAKAIYIDPKMGFAVRFVNLTPEAQKILAKAIELLIEKANP